jgi:hypothetical protein
MPPRSPAGAPGPGPLPVDTSERPVTVPPVEAASLVQRDERPDRVPVASARVADGADVAPRVPNERRGRASRDRRAVRALAGLEHRPRVRVQTFRRARGDGFDHRPVTHPVVRHRHRVRVVGVARDHRHRDRGVARSAGESGSRDGADAVESVRRDPVGGAACGRNVRADAECIHDRGVVGVAVDRGAVDTGFGSRHGVALRAVGGK